MKFEVIVYCISYYYFIYVKKRNADRINVLVENPDLFRYPNILI